ncbi:hypothetical protein [Alkalibacillus aidingensis]|uniref:hypothetical protein n=1 Tax=Alkalibacillus aidingensis TaxID=2747607 RepID=UPI001660F7AA|nr:hypothetical protein [Alkalibacillus aidingensis]
MKEMTSRIFVFLVGIFILIVLNMYGEIFHVLYFHRAVEFFVIVILLGATIYGSLTLNKLLDRFPYKFQLQIVVNIAILIFIAYIIFT